MFCLRKKSSFLNAMSKDYCYSSKKFSMIQLILYNYFYRLSTVFSVFITNFSQVLDQNNDISSCLIEPLLTILHHSPCPSHKTIVNSDYLPTFSLWNLEYYHRRSWLLSLLVILYKVITL